MNASRNEEAIISAFRAGWNARHLYDPLLTSHHNLDADAALLAYLSTLPVDPETRQMGHLPRPKGI